ncbi:uncharacterized protein UHOR_15845 [Ustilago hordei]|uniref:Epoxide hydrolase n=1 Tax=Ustilago hordei TaxID=120017 RepID=I2G1P5_USTHO|nr:uncharacterized protein UHOR_15845 [Ustilago hordei]
MEGTSPEMTSQPSSSEVRGDRETKELADVKYRLNWQFYKMHDFGGHFAALDNPDALVGDMQEFANKNWPGF